MPEEDPGIGTGEEEPQETLEDGETLSEGDAESIPTPEAESDEQGVKDDRPPQNRIAEAQRKQRKAEREAAELRQQLQNQQMQPAVQTPGDPADGYTEEQLAAAFQMDPAKYGWSALKHFVQKELKEAKTGMTQESQKDTLVAESEREATELYPELLDEDSEFRAQVAQELSKAQQRYQRAGIDPTGIPDMVLNIANRVAIQSGMVPGKKGESNLDELSRIRKASRGQAPPVQPKPAKKEEPGVGVSERNIKLAERQGRDPEKAKAFWKKDKVSQQATEMLRRGY